MPNDQAHPFSVSELLKCTGFSSYDDLAATRLSGYFRPRTYALPSWSPQDVRRKLRQFESETIPHSRMISFLGAGTYDFDVAAKTRMQELSPSVPSILGVEAVQRQKVYLARSQELLGARFIPSSATTIHEAWMNLIPWITQARPGRCMVLVSESVDPLQRHRLRRLLPQFGLAYEELPTPSGVVNSAMLLGAIHENTAAVIVSSPNFWGCLESTSEIGQIAHQRGALLGVIVDLLSLFLLRTPEEYRANFCLGDWHTLGVAPRAVGGSSWFWAVNQPSLNDPPRSPNSASLMATQLIAQSLLALDRSQLEKRFETIWNHAHFLRQALGQITGCQFPFSHPFFREFVIKIPGGAEEIIQELEDQGIFVGVSLARDGCPRDWLLLSASELHHATDYTYFLQAFKQALGRRLGKSV